ncbi:HTH domain-containing protein [Lysinibacillus sp. CTST325]
MNPYVKAVNDKSISYTDEFKQFFIDEYEKGKSPREIFLEAGFDIDIIGMTRVKK